MKKLLWIATGLVITVFVALLSVPLFVDVDQYRPVIVGEVNKRINGQLELGKLKLGLWGSLKIHAESIRLSVNGFSGSMVDAQQFRLEIPYMSILGGAPQVTAVLENPRISILKDSRGKTNAMELMNMPGASAESSEMKGSESVAGDSLSFSSSAPQKKPDSSARNGKAPLPPAAPEFAKRKATAEAPQAGNGSATSAPAESGSAPVSAAPLASPAKAAPVQVPKLLAGARLGLKVLNGDLSYLDQLSRSRTQVLGLDLEAKNLGLGSAMSITMSAPVKGSTPEMNFDGPLSASAEIRPILQGTVVKSVSGKIDLDASRLKVDIKGGLFRKTEVMPLLVRAQLEGNETETLLRGLDLQFSDLKVHGKGRITLEPMAAKLDISTDSGSIRLEKFSAFIPLLEPYQLKGSLDFNTDLDWKPAALRVSGDVKLLDGSFFLKEFLKSPLSIKAQAGFSESSLNITRLGLAGPETDIELTGSVKNFLAPQFAIAITGKSLNIDKTLILPSGTSAEAAPLGLPWIENAHAEAGAADVNPMLAFVKNPLFSGATGSLSAQVAKMVAYGAALEQLNLKAQLQAMQLRVSELNFKTFGGTLKGNADLDLKSHGLGYKSQGSLLSVSARDAFATYFPKYKNTIEGKVDGNWNVTGSLFPSLQRMRSLRGTAKILARDGTLKTVDVQETINGTLGKVPFLKGKQVKIEEGFKSFTADLKFENGVVRADPFEMQPRGKGVVLKGKTTIQENLNQETFLDVYDPQRILPQELHSGGKPLLPLHITGALSSPQIDYSYTLQRVASTAGVNVLKDQALKALGVQTTPGMSDQEKLKKAAEELKKKFRF